HPPQLIGLLRRIATCQLEGHAPLAAQVGAFEGNLLLLVAEVNGAESGETSGELRDYLHPYLTTHAERRRDDAYQEPVAVPFLCWHRARRSPARRADSAARQTP